MVSAHGKSLATDDDLITPLPSSARAMVRCIGDVRTCGLGHELVEVARANSIFKSANAQRRTRLVQFHRLATRARSPDPRGGWQRLLAAFLFSCQWVDFKLKGTQ